MRARIAGPSITHSSNKAWRTGDFGPSNVALLVGQWVLPGRQNSVRRGRKPREKSKIDQTLRSGSFEFDLCQKSRGSSPKRTNSIPASPMAIDWNNKMVYVLEFKRTSDQRKDYREKGEARARAQHDVLIRSLEKVAEETESEGERWKVKLIVFVGGTCGSVHVQSFNDNLKELGVVESKRGAIRKGLVHELLYAQDTVLCSYFAQREGAIKGDEGRRNTAAEVFQGLDRFG